MASRVTETSENDMALPERDGRGELSPARQPSGAPRFTPVRWRKKIRRTMLCLAGLCLLPATWVSGAGSAPDIVYRQVAGIVVRSEHSDGNLSIAALAALASRREIDALFLTDHDRMVMEYGVFPLQHIVRWREERNAINRGGATFYVSAIAAAAKKFPEVILVPGAESAPYYYWSGSWMKGNLTAHDHEKRLLAIGLENPEDYRKLPVLHNAPGLKYAAPFVPQLIIFGTALCLGILLARKKGRLRVAGIVLCSFSALLMVNTKPFRSSPFDPYMGNLGIAPYQFYIDHVEGLGGMTIWNYPETRSGVRPLGPIQVSTPPYPDVLEKAKRYTGFAALYGDTTTITNPGGVWDRVLMQYCRGNRRRPVWGISTADYHKENGAGEILGNFITMFLVREKTKKNLIAAMRMGRMYATRGRHPQRPTLPLFTVGAEGTAAQVTMGQEINLSSAPIIRARVSSRIPSNDPITVRLIRSGQPIRIETGPPPVVIDVRDNQFPVGKKGYYRIEARAPNVGTLISNPIFVTRN